MTPADEVGKCPECGSIDRGTRYSITPQLMDGDPLARFCKDDWHRVPPEPPDPEEFTDLEIEVILGLCRGRAKTLPNEEIANGLRITEGVVQETTMSISDKSGGLGRGDLFEFIKTALNAELRRRSGRGESA